jgi:polysaccharide pyruvyl transferase WcaK-like protein
MAVTHIVAPFGFYGAGNVGDEATLGGFAQLLSKSGTHARVSVGSRNPAHTARVEPAFRYFSSLSHDPRHWLANLQATAHAVVGGTPISDVLGDWPLSELLSVLRSIDHRRASALRLIGLRRVPLAFVGVGIETLRMEKSRRIVREEIVPRVRHWSVRSRRDQQRLVENGVLPADITVAADMAWLIEAVTDEFGRRCLQRWGAEPGRPLVGVNVVNENNLLDRQPELLEVLAGALDEIADEMGAQIVFFANDVREDPCFDKAAATQVIGRMKNPDRALRAPNHYFSPREMLSLVGCCQLTLSMRYHSCLFSAVQGVPFIAVNRSDKVADLCWDMGWSASVAPTRADVGRVAGLGRSLREDRSRYCSELREGVERMRSRALRNVIALEALTGGRAAAVGARAGSGGELR